MRRFSGSWLLPTMLAVAICANAAAAQGRGGQPPRVAASTRASAALCLSSQCRLTDTSTVAVLIEYGVPHARGREVWGTLVPLDSVWRLGANTSTHLVTKHALSFGGAAVPPGKYTLYLRPAADGGHLIVSKATGQWGIPYPGAGEDLVRIPMRMRNLAESVETLAIEMVPGGSNPNAGTLHVTWGRRQFSADWSLQAGALQ